MRNEPRPNDYEIAKKKRTIRASRSIQGRSGAPQQHRLSKLLHDLVTPEDEQELVQRRRPDQHQFLLTSVWGFPILGPNTPEYRGYPLIQGSAFELEVDEDSSDDESWSE